MNEQAPSVSVLVPCFNGERHLPMTLASLEALNWSNLEIIFVDDGSTDQSLTLLRQFSNHSRHRTQVLRQTNQGAASARNAAFAASTGAWIQYLDADDLLDADKLDWQIADLEQSGALMNAGSWGRFDRDPAETRFQPCPEPNPMSAAEYLRQHLGQAFMMQPSVFVVHRTLIEQSGGFDPTLSLNDDGEFFARVLAQAGSLRFVPRARCRYRSGSPGSLASTRSEAALNSALRAMQSTVRTALNLDHGAPMRLAAATGMARVAAYLAPHSASLAERAWQEALSLDPNAHWDEGGRSYRWLKPWLGWRSARRFEHWLANWRARYGGAR